MSRHQQPVPLPFNPNGLIRSAAEAPGYLKPVFWAAIIGDCELAFITPTSGPFPSPGHLAAQTKVPAYWPIRATWGTSPSKRIVGPAPRWDTPGTPFLRL